MRSRSVALAIFLTTLAAGAAIGCHFGAASYRSRADWLLERGNAEAAEYANSFNGALADKELATFEERRGLLEQARRWQMAQMLAVMASVVGVFGSYLLFLFAGLRDQLDEGTAELDESAALPPSV